MTDLGKTQLNAILSALDGQPRNPNTKDAALRRIGAHAERYGLGLDDLLAAAAGFLDGRMSAESFRTSLQDDAAEAAGRIEPLETKPPRRPRASRAGAERHHRRRGRRRTRSHRSRPGGRSGTRPRSSLPPRSASTATAPRRRC